MGENSIQETFDDLRTRQHIKKLTPTQINIIEFLEQGYYGSFIAKRLKISKSYVSRTINELTSYGLIIPQVFEITYQGKTKKIARADPIQGNATTYAITEKLKTLLHRETALPSASYTLCTPHHLKIKYPILSLKGELSFNGWKSRTKTIYIKSWKPRGGERHLWHVNTKNGIIGVEYHGKSIIGYRCDRDHIMAESVEEATQLAATYVQTGIDIWLKEQQTAGAKIALGSAESITKPHYAFESNIAKEIIKAGAGISIPGMFVDNSPEAHGNPNIGEIETTDPAIATMVDQGLRKALNLEGIVDQKVASAMCAAMPTFIDTMNGRLDTLQEELTGVSSRLTDGMLLQGQFNLLVQTLNDTVKELEKIKQTVTQEVKEPDPSPPPPEPDDLMMYQ